MNGKPDEHLDQWVRHSLGELPDTLPPGSSFNAERLWGQISPQPAAKRTPRLPKRAWWAAAACLVGVVSAGIWQKQRPPATLSISHQHQSKRQKIEPISIFSGDFQPIVGTISSGTAPVVTNSRKKTNQLPALKQPALREEAVLPLAAPIAAANQESALPGESVAVIAPANAAEPTTPTRVTAAPKRRFRVVHINELAAGAEVRPAPDHPERFVRLGTGPGLQSASDDSSHPIVLSLATKSTQ